MFDLSNKYYDIAKDFVTVVLPALATLYATIASIWGLDFSIEIVGTVSAIATFLGILLKVNSVSFKKNNTMVSDVDLSALEQAPAGVTLQDVISGNSL